MARPVKNYCDYFPHDRDMRNHRKIKALRTKFGIAGYGIWVMTLEYLTGIDGNVFEFSDMELELMSGDYGVSATEIRDVLDYCIRMELLFLKDGFIHSESLDERLKPVYDKRDTSKGISKKQLRSNGKFGGNNTVPAEVSVAEMPQSKVNKSKVNKSKVNNTADANTVLESFDKKDEPDYWRPEVKRFLADSKFKYGFCTAKQIPLPELEKQMNEFVIDLNLNMDYKDIAGLKRHFTNRFNKKEREKESAATKQMSSSGFIGVPNNIDYENLQGRW